MKYFTFLIACSFTLASFAQQPLIYVVEFENKTASPYSFSQPEQFLSERAINRRLSQGIAIDSTDFPPNPAYIDSIRSTGAEVWARSRWMNLIVIRTTDSTILNQINSFSFVRNSSRVKRTGASTDTTVSTLSEKKCRTAASFDYGLSFNQANMIGADFLHNMGFRGDSMVIAVLDAGFYQVDSLPVFDSLRANNRILGTWDFVQNEASVYEDHTHGMHVLSAMGGNLPGQLIGTAPNAGYWLLRSEEAATETISEEYFWVAAAEFADSSGADLINSSLGYTEFDDPSWNHTYQDLDGNTTVITRGADMAASKGILVVNSAGNSGSSPWRYIGAPADGDSVLAVGAVDPATNIASFSSHGPSADGRVKPNVAAQGQQTIVASAVGGVIAGNGTSFSAPVLTGAVACLWQAKKAAGNMDIIRAVEKSAHKFSNPDTLYGYGIPDMALALQFLGIPVPDLSIENVGAPYPNPFYDKFIIPITLTGKTNVSIEVSDMSGRIVVRESFLVEGSSYLQHEICAAGHLAAGVYLVSVRLDDRVKVLRMIKQR